MATQPASDALPVDVTAAIQQGKKIEAIKRLREARQIELKEAKDLVDRCLRNDPELARRYREEAAKSRRVLWIVVIAAIFAVWYLLL